MHVHTKWVISKFWLVCFVQTIVILSRTFAYYSQIVHHSYLLRVNERVSVWNCQNQLQGRTVSRSRLYGRALFNPFLRNKSTRKNWFDQGLDGFYRFVDEQPLLTPDQEQLYGKAVKLWNYIAAAKQALQDRAPVNTTISTCQVADAVGCSMATLAKIASFAEYSEKRLINSNFKLVLSVVSRYRREGIENVELITAGAEGLSKAVRKFDYSKGFRFATYATWYVHQAVADYVRKQKTMLRLPGKYTNIARQIKQFSAVHQREYRSQPSLQTIARALGLPTSEISDVIQSQLPVAQLYQRIPSSSRRSLRAADILPSASSRGDDKNSIEEFERLMADHLTDIEIDVLRFKHGLEDGIERPIKEVGRRYNVSWRKLREIEDRAKAKLVNNVKPVEYARILMLS